ncbi:MAG: copper resistance D family protein, partial [Amnibacterium sp.]
MNRAARVASPALLVVAALAALLAALAIGGAAQPAGAYDPGAVVRYGLPVVLLVVNLAVALTLGTLVLASFALSPADPRWGRALDTAAGAAAVWTVASAGAGVLAFIDTFLVPVTDPRFGSQVLYYLTSIALGQSWLATTLAAALITVLAVAIRSHTGVALLTAGTAAALIPMSLQGHAASAPGDHETAVTAFGLHIVFAAVWLGGLLALVLFGTRSRGERLTALVSRYSSVALVCFGVVALTGIVSAAIRLGSWGALLTPYGALIVVKSLALLAAGAFGALYRLVLIPRLAGERGPRVFFGVVVGELVVLGVASGFAAALSLSAP